MADPEGAPVPSPVTMLDLVPAAWGKPTLRKEDFVRLTRELEAAAAAGQKAVVIRSVIPGKFAFGADLDDAKAQTGDVAGYLEAVNGLWSTIEAIGMGVVVAVDGPAVGAGFELCLCADSVVASDRSWFSFPEVRFGLPAITATRRLEAAGGRALAKRLMLTGKRLTAADALAAGLVEAVVPTADLEATAREIAAQFAQSDPQAMREIKAELRTPPLAPAPAAEYLIRAFAEKPD